MSTSSTGTSFPYRIFGWCLPDTDCSVVFHAAFDGINEVRTKTGGRKNMIQRPYFERPMHAVHAIELLGHLTQLLRVYDFEEFVPLQRAAEPSPCPRPWPSPGSGLPAAHLCGPGPRLRWQTPRPPPVRRQ